MKKRIIILISLLLSTSCFYDTTWDIQLWEQKIENSNLSIFKFDASGGRDSMISGMKILKSKNGFNQKDVTSSEKLSYLLQIPNNNEIKGVYRLDNPSIQNVKGVNLKKIKTDIKGYHDYHGKRKQAQHINGHYKFKTYKETRDSIIFYSNNSVYVNDIDFKRISIPKGNVYLMSSRDNMNVTRITSETVVFMKEEKTGEVKIYTEHIVFDPINEIKLNEFTNYGIYKPVKKRQAIE
jgi:hypothetical protein